MILRNWIVIIVLACIGLYLAVYWMSLPEKVDGVTPQSGTDNAVTAVAALAGAITTLGGAVFGVLGKLNEYKKARLEIEEKQIEIAAKKQSSADP